MHRGFYKSCRLPHFDAAAQLQFITFVLADAAPKQQKSLISTNRKSGDQEFLEMDSELDRHRGSCLLKKPEIGSLVLASMLRDAGNSHIPLSWVIMPNHIHLLTAQLPGNKLSEIVRRIKGRSSHEINRLRGCTGQVWQNSFFDRAIRSMEHLGLTIDYIHDNPVKARLCHDPSCWQFSSIHEFSAEKLLARIEKHHLQFLS